MANFNQLKADVANQIKTNGVEAITGAVMQDVLLTIINSIADGYMFGGVAQHSGDVGNPDYNVFYLGGSGSYTGYGESPLNVPDGCYCVMMYNGTWHQYVVDLGVHLTGEVAEGETQGVTGDKINTALNTLFTIITNILDSLEFVYNTPAAQKGTKAMLDATVTLNGVPRVLATLVLGVATAEEAGLLSAEDKAKLDAILANIRSMVIVDTTESEDEDGKLTETLKWTVNGAEEVICAFTILAATTSKAGLLSADDKKKIDSFLNIIESMTFEDTTAYADQGEKIEESVHITVDHIDQVIAKLTLLAATTSKAGLLSAADKAKLDALWSSGYQFVGIATPSTTPISTTSKIFYIATEAGTYFNAVTVTQGINILSWDGTSWSAVQVIGIDDEPTAGSDRLVESGGIFGELALGAVYDVSAKNPTAGPNNDGKFESLSALLSDDNLNTLIPTAVRKGGMSIKFVQSSDNKYVQYRLMNDEWSTTVGDWQGVDEGPTAGSNNLVMSRGVAELVFPIKDLQDVSLHKVIMSDYALANGFIRPSGEWATNAAWGNNIQHIVIPISSYIGEKIYVISGKLSLQCAFISAYNVVNEQSAGMIGALKHIAGGYNLVSYTVPAEAAYLYVLMKNFDGDIKPNDIILKNDYDFLVTADRSQTFTDLQKDTAQKNIGLPTTKYLLLEYWGQDTQDLADLSNGAYFYNSYSHDICKKISEVGVTPVLIEHYPIKKDCLYLYENNFYYSVDNATLTKVTDPSISQIFGTATDKTISQKVLTDTYNSVTSRINSIDILITETGYEELTPVIESGKYIQSNGNINEYTNFYIYIYNLENVANSSILQIVASTAFAGNKFYAFYNSSTFSSETMVLGSTNNTESGASGNVTFENVSIPSGATYLVVTRYGGLGTASAQASIKWILNPTAGSLYGKKWACVGDSLTADNIRTTKHYYDYIADECGVIPLNYGYGGSGWARLMDEQHAFFQRISSIDPTSDIVTIFGSFNDIASITTEFPLGTITDTGTSTMGGVINTCIDNLYSIMPVARLGIVSPTPWNTARPTTSGVLYDYVSLIERICIHRSIPFLNLWTCSNLRPWDAAFLPYAYSKDEGNGVHPDETGHKIIAPKFREFIKFLI